MGDPRRNRPPRSGYWDLEWLFRGLIATRLSKLDRTCWKRDWHRRGLFDRVNILVFSGSFSIGSSMVTLVIYWIPYTTVILFDMIKVLHIATKIYKQKHRKWTEEWLLYLRQCELKLDKLEERTKTFSEEGRTENWKAQKE
jgi:hypothetical protein